MRERRPGIRDLPMPPGMDDDLEVDGHDNSPDFRQDQDRDREHNDREEETGRRREHTEGFHQGNNTVTLVP